MTETASSRDNRGQVAALCGLILQVVLCLLLVLTYFLVGTRLAAVAARWMAGGVVIWLPLVLVYRQRRRTAAERLEVDELRRSQQTTGLTNIFDSEDESYLLERRRLNWLLRWLVPGSGLVLAIYHLAGTFVGWGWSLGTSLADVKWTPTRDAGPAMAFVGGVGFLAFLFSRYTSGMARLPSWRLLRAGASYLAGNALCCLAILAAIALENGKVPLAELIAAQAIRVAMFVLGVEFVVNYLLDFYRPRQPGQESRPAFDSRLLGLVSEPGGIARSIAEAINYQFGFEVSKTWFYQLLKRASLPMVAFMLLCLFLLSAVLIVDADEQVFVERFGVRLQPGDRPLDAGLYFKAPWPIDRVYRTRAHEVRTLRVGDAPKEDEVETIDGVTRPKPILWGQEHKFNPEMMLVVASPELTNLSVSADTGPGAPARPTGKAVAVGLLMVSVDIQYSVSDLQGYLYNYADPEKVVGAIAYQVLTDYAAQVDADRFMGEGRGLVNAELARILQQRLDDLKTGIQVLFVGVQEAHPPTDVAKVYQSVVAAERNKSAAIEKARGMAVQTLTAVAGNSNRAMILDAAVQEWERLAQDEGADQAAVDAARSRVDDLLLGSSTAGLTPTGGTAARLIAEAQSEARTSLTQAESDVAVFDAEVVAYQAAPRLYQLRRYLDTLERALVDIRKFVVAADTSKTRLVIIYEKEEKGTIELGEPPRPK